MMTVVSSTNIQKLTQAIFCAEKLQTTSSRFAPKSKLFISLKLDGLLVANQNREKYKEPMRNEINEYKRS